MPKMLLTDEHRAFLVREMACFASPSEACKALKEEYGIEMDRRSAIYYNPTYSHSRGKKPLGKKWVEMFNTLREAFIKDCATSIPEAHKAVRVRKLAEASRRAEARGNDVLMADMLERVAKEVGNVHTNKREITGKDGGPIKYEEVETMSDAELDAELARYGVTVLPQPGEAETH